jgi:crotonobetainyl-CoA:carnitine CoA-transferase CaiB-like acyl-CoA transferase
MTDRPEPLTGLRVLDLSRVLAGPLAAQTLGDLGADVIKIEHPTAGDETRGWGPPFTDEGQSAYFLSCNRNKLGMTADLDDPTDRAAVQRLIDGADVVIENFRAGALARRGLDPAAVLAAHPRLVWCTIRGFAAGDERPGYDAVVQAESGWMAITGETDGAPMKVGVALADVLAAKDAVTGVLAALLARDRPGASRHVTATLAHGAVAALVNVALNTLVTGAPPARWGNAHPNLVPYQTFTARDRALVLAVGNDAQWRAAAGALGLDLLAADPALATNAGRVRHRARVVAAVAARLATDDAAVWCARFDAAGVPCGVVKTVPEALATAGAALPHGVPPLPPGRVRRPAPRLGEHDAAVRARGWAACA